MGEEAGPQQTQELVDQAAKLRWHVVPARFTGYVQGLDEQQLLSLARQLVSVVRMEHGIGGFVAQGAALVSVAHYEETTGKLTPEVIGQLNNCFSVGTQGTIEQDAGFGLRQIVGIALKALSPGINETTTALMAVDHRKQSIIAASFEKPKRPPPH